MYRDLYSGSLAPYSWIDKFIPHVGIGGFAKRQDQTEFETFSEIRSYKEGYFFDEPGYKEALKEAKNLSLVYPIKIEELTLVDLNETFTISNDVETVRL